MSLLPAPHQFVITRVLISVCLSALMLLLIGEAYLLLQWPLLREAHYLHYIAYLINEHNFTPYRDIFETSWPVTFLFHMLVGKVLGYTDFAVRLVDIAWLMALMSATWLILKRLNTHVALMAALLFGLGYINSGPNLTLQRDYLAILPITIALLIAQQSAWNLHIRSLLIGALGALPFLIKPLLVAGMPVIAVYLALETRGNKSFWWHLLRVSSGSLAGGFLVITLVFVWLWHCGGLYDFFDIVLQYLPLYMDIDGAHHMTTSDKHARQAFMWWQWFTGYWQVPVIGGLLRGFWIARRHAPAKRLIIALGVLLVIYNLYPLPAGKYWDYHWLPFKYFAAVCSAFLLLPPTANTWRAHTGYLCCVLIFIYTLHGTFMPSPTLKNQWAHYPDLQIHSGNATELAEYLRTHLKAGDTVQPLDTGGISSHGMLMAKAVLATPFLEEYPFYHHVSNSYIQSLQARMMHALNEKPPRFFIDMDLRVHADGFDTIKKFTALDAFMTQHYIQVYRGSEYTIYEKQP